MLETSPYTTENSVDRTENVSRKPSLALLGFVMDKASGTTPEAEVPQLPSRQDLVHRGRAALIGSDIGLLARGL